MKIRVQLFFDDGRLVKEDMTHVPNDLTVSFAGYGGVIEGGLRLLRYDLTMKVVRESDAIEVPDDDTFLTTGGILPPP